LQLIDQPAANDSQRAGAGKQEGDKAGEGQKSGKKQGQGSGRKQGQGGEQRKDSAQPPDQQKDQRSPAEKPKADGKGANPQPSAEPPPAAQSAPSRSLSFLQQLAPYVKWLLYGLLAAIGLYVILRHWSAVAAYLARLWAEFLALFGWKSDADRRASAESKTNPVRPKSFADYDNPFTNGTARRMKPAQLLDYTFQALEAWARDRGVTRSEDTTPLEFAQELGRRVPEMANEVTRTAQLYAQVAYARKTPAADSVEVLERLWRQMDAAGLLATSR